MEIQWSLVFYTLLIGLGAGTFAVAASSEWWGKAERARLPGAITAIVSMALAGVASFLHLGHPERALGVLGNIQSGIGQEMLLAGLTGLLAVAYALMLWRGGPAGTRKIVAGAGMALAVILCAVMGASYMLPARPAWNTVFVPLLYLASAASLGLLAVFFWVAARTPYAEREAAVKAVGKAGLIALAVQALVTVAYVIYLATAPDVSVGRVLGGDLALVFWLGVVLVGLLVPLGFIAWLVSAKKELVPFTTAAATSLVCVFLGGIAVRVMFFLLGSRVLPFH